MTARRLRPPAGRRLADERRRWDPLSGWLADRDLWGERARVGVRRSEALALVRPGWAPSGAPSGTPSGGGPVLGGVLLGEGEAPGLTAKFVERAYAFPVAVEPDVGSKVGAVRKRWGRHVRLRACLAGGLRQRGKPTEAPAAWCDGGWEPTGGASYSPRPVSAWSSSIFLDASALDRLS